MTQDAFQEIPYTVGYDSGLGFASASGVALNQAIKAAAEPVLGAPAGFGKYEVLRVETTEDLENALGISADAKGGIALFKVSDKFEFSKSCKLQVYSLAIVVRAVIETGFLQIKNLELTDAAAKLAQTDPTGFVTVYGDYFIRGLRRGGQFFGVVRIDSQTADDRTSIKNTLDGAYGLFSADVMVSLTETIKKTTSRTQVMIYYEGGTVVFGSLAPDQIATVLGAWSATVKDNSAPYAIKLAPYKIVNGFIPPNQVDLEHQRDILVRCAKLRSYATTALNQVEYVLENQPDFIAVDVPTLTSLRSSLATDLDIIAEAASFSIESPVQAVEPETFARTKQGLPNYKLTILPSPMPSLKPGPVPLTPTFNPHPKFGAGLNGSPIAASPPADRHDIWSIFAWESGRRAPANFWDAPQPIITFLGSRWLTAPNDERLTYITMRLFRCPLICGWMTVDLSATNSVQSISVDVGANLDLYDNRQYTIKGRFIQVARDGAFTESELQQKEVTAPSKGSETLRITLKHADDSPTSCPPGFDYYLELGLWQISDSYESFNLGHIEPHAGSLEILGVVIGT